VLVADFDFELPDAAIAQEPVARGESRLLVLDAVASERHRTQANTGRTRNAAVTTVNSAERPNADPGEGGTVGVSDRLPCIVRRARNAPA